MQKWAKTNKGFTIVELLIVIVVIAILAAISIVAYNGIQVRARDAKRVNDIAVIKKQVINYQSVNGSIPGPFVYGSTGGGGWDNSTLSGWMSFVDGTNKMPRDPVNNLSGDPGDVGGGAGTGYGYFYFCHQAPTHHVDLGYFKEAGGRTRVVETIQVERCT